MSDERSTHGAWVRVELHDATLDEARKLYDVDLPHELTELRIGDTVLDVIKVQRDLTRAEQREIDARRREQMRYRGD